MGVAVGFPAGGAQIDFDVAGFGFGGADLDDGAEEIGAGLMVPEAGVEDSDGLGLGGGELVATDALVGPDFLKPTFGGSALSEGLVEPELGFAGFPPPKIETLGQRHLLNGHRTGGQKQAWRGVERGLEVGGSEPWRLIPDRTTLPIRGLLRALWPGPSLCDQAVPPI